MDDDKRLKPKGLPNLNAMRNDSPTKRSGVMPLKPLKDVQYNGLVEHDMITEIEEGLLPELSAIDRINEEGVLPETHGMSETLKGFKERQEKDMQRFYDAVMLGYFFTVVFPTQRQRDQFLDRINWNLGNHHLDGMRLAKILGVEVDDVILSNADQKPSSKVTGLVADEFVKDPYAFLKTPKTGVEMERDEARQQLEYMVRDYNALVERFNQVTEIIDLALDLLVREDITDKQADEMVAEIKRLLNVTFPEMTEGN